MAEHGRSDLLKEFDFLYRISDRASNIRLGGKVDYADEREYRISFWTLDGAITCNFPRDSCPQLGVGDSVWCYREGTKTPYILRLERSEKDLFKIPEDKRKALEKLRKTLRNSP